jgi:hypothetical protein
MATSPNYGWSEPDNTSLVKDGALAMRSLGDAIDTSLWNSGYGQAGKNKLINGDFGIWQRGTSVSGALTGNYLADRWWMANGNGPIERSTDAPNGFAYSFFNNSSGTITMGQAIELPATGKSWYTAGQTVTLSMYLKGASAGSISAAVMYRNEKFTGTNQVSFTTTSPNPSFTTSWARYSMTFTVPTINANNTIIALEFGSVDAGLRIAGVQLEFGSTATPFQTATGTIQGELAACQRYYYRLEPLVANARYGVGFAESSTVAAISIALPVQMRVRPSALEQSGTAGDYQVRFTGLGTATCSSVPVYVTSSANVVGVEFTVASGLTAGQGLTARAVNTSGFLGWSAEL